MDDGLLSNPLHILTGMVLFLEEDHYVSDDFLHVLHLVDAERTSRYPNCDIICLGTYLKSYNYKRDQKTVSHSTMYLNSECEKKAFCSVNSTWTTYHENRILLGIIQKIQNTKHFVSWLMIFFAKINGKYSTKSYFEYQFYNVFAIYLPYVSNAFTLR